MQDPMQSPEQNPGPDPGPSPGEQPGPGPAPGQLPGPGPGPDPGQFPGPGPGPNPGPMPGQKAGPSALSDPPSARPLRMAVIALGALSLIFLIAGTAVDEYTGYTAQLGFSYTKTSKWFGCQNVVDRSKSKYLPNESIKLTFKYMNTLSFIIILTTSFLCVIQAAATGVNVVVLLLGKLHKGALVVSSVVPFLLLLAIVMANINFSGKRFITQHAGIGHYKEELEAVKLAKELGVPMQKPVFTLPGQFEITPIIYKGIDETIMKFDTWGSSYGLICAAFAFAVINQILLAALHKIAMNDGVATFGAFIKTALKPAKIVPVIIFLVNLLLLAMMFTGVLLDSYIDGGVDSPCLIGAMQNGCNGHITHNDTIVIKKKIAEIKKDKEIERVAEQIQTNYARQAPLFMNAHVLAIALFSLTSLACLLLLAATALSLVQMLKNKNLSIPLLGVSGVTVLLLIISVALACVEFKASNHEGNILTGLGLIKVEEWNARNNITEERPQPTTPMPNMPYRGYGHGPSGHNMDPRYMNHGPSVRLPRHDMEPAEAGPYIKSGEKKIEERVTFSASFHILATALAFALVNAVLNALNMFVFNKGEKGPTQPGPGTMKVSSTQPSSAGVGPSPLEATCQNPTEATCQNPSTTA